MEEKLIEEDAYKSAEELQRQIDNKYSHNPKYINQYHKLYERKRIWENNTWLGIPCWKLPMDAFVIQELIYKTRPDIIIETGTGHGGSALFYASVCELIGHGRVLSVDIDREKFNSTLNRWGNTKCEERISFFIGDSIETVRSLGDYIDKNCMVILDSWHSREHVYKEMLVYSKFVKSGGYMIIEDSHAAGNPVPWEHEDDGPMGAILQWMHSYGDKWEIDRECEKHLLTFNPRGYLRRK